MKAETQLLVLCGIPQKLTGQVFPIGTGFLHPIGKLESADA
jgi:hypothetical protein